MSPNLRFWFITIVGTVVWSLVCIYFGVWMRRRWEKKEVKYRRDRQRRIDQQENTGNRIYNRLKEVGAKVGVNVTKKTLWSLYLIEFLPVGLLWIDFHWWYDPILFYPRDAQPEPMVRYGGDGKEILRAKQENNQKN